MPYPFTPSQVPETFDLDSLGVTPPDIDFTFHEKVVDVFAVPAPLATVTITVDDSARYAIGVPLYFAGFGIFRVTGLPSSTGITIESVTAATGVSVPIGTPFCTCALPETADEPAATDNLIYDTLATSFVVPAVGADASIEVIRGGWFVLNAVIFVENAGWFKISNPYDGSDKKCVAAKLFDNGSAAAGGTIPAGARVHAATELPYTPDNDTIVHSMVGVVPGTGRIAVAGKYPTTPGTAGVKIVYGETAPNDAYNTTLTDVAVVFADAFEDPPHVTITLVAPNVGNTSLPSYGLKVVSETGFTIFIDCQAALGAGAYFLWSAIGK